MFQTTQYIWPQQWLENKFTLVCYKLRIVSRVDIKKGMLIMFAENCKTEINATGWIGYEHIIS